MASAELRAGWRALRTRVPGRWDIGLARPGLAVGAVTRDRIWMVVREALAIGCLAAAFWAVFWPVVLGVGIYAESDTLTYFFPVFAALHASLRAGELPLWTPHVFGGFPLFAEGQIGALYPPALLAAQLPTPADGFLALRAFHAGVALLGSFLLARVLGVSPPGAVIGALAFGLGSFVVGQQHHANLLAATVWLPLLLACVERALTVQGWASHRLLGLAALIYGIQALATHVQPLMIGGALLGAYVLTRQTWGALVAIRRHGPWRGAWVALGQLVDGLTAVLFVGAVGALIGAAQILPLYELSQESWRARGWSYLDATEYSLPIVNLVTLIFPFFFRLGGQAQWSLWQLWESVLYVGVIPLLLAVAAAFGVRRWATAFFAGAAVLSGLVALGGYAPYGLYDQLWQIPGMNLQRAPARFTLITTLALAMLAAFGADWMGGRWSRRRRGPRGPRRLVLLQVGTLGLLGALVAHLAIWRAWLQEDRSWATEALAATYLQSRHDPLQPLQPLNVVLGLESSLDLGNPKTALPLVLLALFAVLALAWREIPRARKLWQAVLVGLVAVDLVIFASDFHPLLDVDTLGDVGPAGTFLVQHAGRDRVLTSPDVLVPQPNELLPSEVSEVSGYSPLELERHRWYAASVGTVDNVLLDLWGVRWLVQPAHGESLPSYGLVSFHPRRPLMIGGFGTPNGQIVLQVAGEPATAVRWIVGLSGGEAIGDGQLVGEWLVTGTNGVRTVLPVRAGREIADWRLRAAGQPVAHPPIQAATTIRIGEGETEPRMLGFAEMELPGRMEVASVEYRHLHQQGRTIMYGLGLYDRDEDVVGQIGREDRYRPAYRDASVAIFENAAAYPRAFVVPEAVLVPDGPAALARLRDGPLDPRRQVVLESAPGLGLGPFDGTPASDATIVAEGGGALVIRATAPAGGYLVLTDPYYPGWRALVDGVEVAILRADYLFRAVPLPAGAHTVEFVFEPKSLEQGVSLSLAGVGVAGGTMLLGMVGPLATLAYRRVAARVRRARWRRQDRPSPPDSAANVPTAAADGDNADASPEADLITDQASHQLAAEPAADPADVAPRDARAEAGDRAETSLPEERATGAGPAANEPATGGQAPEPRTPGPTTV